MLDLCCRHSFHRGCWPWTLVDSSWEGGAPWVLTHLKRASLNVFLSTDNREMSVVCKSPKMVSHDIAGYLPPSLLDWHHPVPCHLCRLRAEEVPELQQIWRGKYLKTLWIEPMSLCGSLTTSTRILHAKIAMMNCQGKEGTSIPQSALAAEMLQISKSNLQITVYHLFCRLVYSTLCPLILWVSTGIRGAKTRQALLHLALCTWLIIKCLQTCCCRMWPLASCVTGRQAPCELFTARQFMTKFECCFYCCRSGMDA